MNTDTTEIQATHKDFIGIYENALSDAHCEYLIKEYEKEVLNAGAQFKFGKFEFPIGELGRRDFQIYYSVDEEYIKKGSIENKKVVDVVNDALNKCITIYAEEFFTIKGIQASSKEVKLQKTPPRGGYHLWHCEQSGIETANRMLAWSIYLNDVPDGEGETEFIWQGVKVPAKKGSVCLFPAAFTHTHRGNPVYTHDKYIATGWYAI
jgi:hypothetical protein